MKRPLSLTRLAVPLLAVGLLAGCHSMQKSSSGIVVECQVYGAAEEHWPLYQERAVELPPARRPAREIPAAADDEEDMDELPGPRPAAPADWPAPARDTPVRQA